MITLTKANETSKIKLNKRGPEILATARWVDNGDEFDDNDDLDLRAGILLPDGRMKIVYCGNPGALQQEPFVWHAGDVQAATEGKPGEETMQVNPEISARVGGPVAIVFSVYSAIENGDVSIASLKPVMRLQYQDQVVECALDFTKDPAALEEGVYTYVLGVAVIRGDEVEVRPGGAVSEPFSEATPWLEWDAAGNPVLTMDGPMVTKDDVFNEGGGGFFSKLFGGSKKKKQYA